MATIYLSVFASLLHIVAYAVYNRQIFQGKSTPNTATWSIWVFLTLLNSSSYVEMSGDMIKGLLPSVSALACLITFAVSLVKGKLSRLDFWDSVVLAIGLMAGYVWWQWQSATYANMMLQVAFALSCWPTIRGVWKKPSTEKPLPWFVWGVAFALSTSVVLLRWRGQPEDLVYHLIGLAAHPLIGLLAMRKQV